MSGPPTVDRDDWTLRIAGAVERPLELSYDDLRELPPEAFTEDFECVEGWVDEDRAWRGVRFGTVLDRAEPAGSEYGLVRALDGEFACSYPIEELQGAVLALELDGEPLSPERGGPARLVPIGSDADCWESVKWVAAVELLESEPTEADTAKDIALSG